ncbi:albumin 1-like [Diretmus argenteus]
MRAVCSTESLLEKNNLKSCCGKLGAERISCFRDQKTKFPRDLLLEPEFPAEERTCTDFKKDGKAFFEDVTYSLSKWYPMLPPQVILGIVKSYSKLVMSCCEEAEIQTCFDTKKAAFEEGVRSRIAQQRNICIIHKRYGDRVVMDKTIVEYVQRFPESPEEVLPLVKEFMSTVAPCCQGDMITCMKLRMEHIDELCNATSGNPSLAECCKQDVFSREGCISSMKPDPKPGDESERYDLQGNIKTVCDSFNTSPDQAIINLLSEQSRRHPEASRLILLHYATAAEQAFANCCAKEDCAECVKTNMEGVNLEQSISYGIAIHGCARNRLAAFGPIGFEERLLMDLTRTIPQATFQQLHQLSKIATDAYKGCLEDNVLTCDDKNYSRRLLCIMHMNPITNFQSPDEDIKTFPLGPVLCSKDDKVLAVPHKKLIYGLVRLKTTISPQEYSVIWNLFNITRTKCCRKEDQESCFNIEGPRLINLGRQMLQFDNTDHYSKPAGRHLGMRSGHRHYHHHPSPNVVLSVSLSAHLISVRLQFTALVSGKSLRQS